MSQLGVAQLGMAQLGMAQLGMVGTLSADIVVSLYCRKQV